MNEVCVRVCARSRISLSPYVKSWKPFQQEVVLHFMGDIRSQKEEAQRARDAVRKREIKNRRGTQDKTSAEQEKDSHRNSAHLRLPEAHCLHAVM